MSRSNPIECSLGRVCIGGHTGGQSKVLHPTCSSMCDAPCRPPSPHHIGCRIRGLTRGARPVGGRHPAAQRPHRRPLMRARGLPGWHGPRPTAFGRGRTLGAVWPAWVAWEQSRLALHGAPAKPSRPTLVYGSRPAHLLGLLDVLRLDSETNVLCDSGIQRPRCGRDLRKQRTVPVRARQGCDVLRRHRDCGVAIFDRCYCGRAMPCNLSGRARGQRATVTEGCDDRQEEGRGGSKYVLFPSLRWPESSHAWLLH